MVFEIWPLIYKVVLNFVPVPKVILDSNWTNVDDMIVIVLGTVIDFETCINAWYIQALYLLISMYLIILLFLEAITFLHLRVSCIVKTTVLIMTNLPTHLLFFRNYSTTHINTSVRLLWVDQTFDFLWNRGIAMQIVFVVSHIVMLVLPWTTTIIIV